ncbi:MAG TPA: DNA repair protein RecN [Candidatus Binataceae bacterium]|nr:DNA repair protein RecN [Candidatus Binataceae bacterium]
MLIELRIRNFAIIKEAELEFGPGLNVLSGETGAGKTIIMSALGLLLGIRASPDMIRAPAKEAIVEGRFELEGDSPAIEALSELPGQDSSHELLIRRTIAESGRARVVINDQLATVQTLAHLGANLVQVYGQHEQQSLLRNENHRQILDRHAGLEAELAAYRVAYDRAKQCKLRLEELSRRENERVAALELARFRAAELEGANLKSGEDQELNRERTVLANAARLMTAAAEAQQLLNGDDGAAAASIARAGARLTEAAALDPKIAEVFEMVAAARANLEEAARTLEDYLSRDAADPGRLEEIETRLQELTRLKRKYGGTLESALETLASSRAELAALENIESDRAAAARDLEEALGAVHAQADELHRRRLHNGVELKRLMETELRTLGMRNAGFETRFATVDESETGLSHGGITLGPTGADALEFLFAPNLGQTPMPLAKIASGGELSRVMLALKRLEAQRRGLPTMIFDEVDAGIGGEIAQVVGRKLKQLARFHQVLCVTHLPQIAAFADRHFVVEKRERGGSTVSRVLALAPAERTDEIARMLGGAQVSDQLRRAARELLDRAQG